MRRDAVPRRPADPRETDRRRPSTSTWRPAASAPFDAPVEALVILSTTEIQRALTPSVGELPWLQSRHAAVMRFFQSVADTNDLDARVRVLEPKDVRADAVAADRIEILVREEGRGPQVRPGQGERDGARHPPRDQRPRRGEPRLLPVPASAAGGDHRAAPTGTPGCGQAAIAPEQPPRRTEGRADPGPGHRPRRRGYAIYGLCSSTARAPSRRRRSSTTSPTATWRPSSTRRSRRSPIWSTDTRKKTGSARCAARSSAGSAPAGSTPRRRTLSPPKSWTWPRCGRSDDRQPGHLGRHLGR